MMNVNVSYVTIADIALSFFCVPGSSSMCSKLMIWAVTVAVTPLMEAVEFKILFVGVAASAFMESLEVKDRFEGVFPF